MEKKIFVNWEELFDGRERIIRRGRDYSAKTDSMRVYIYQKAKINKLFVSVQINYNEDYLIVQAFKNKFSKRNKAKHNEFVKQEDIIEDYKNYGYSDEDKITYFIQKGAYGPIKIGSTTISGLKARINNLQVSCEVKLIVRALTTVNEKYLHGLFSRWKLSGEWFDPSQELLDYIQETKKKYESEEVMEEREDIIKGDGFIIYIDDCKDKEESDECQ